MADILNMRNRHSSVFLMGTDVGRLLDHIAIELVHQVVYLHAWSVSAVLLVMAIFCCVFQACLVSEHKDMDGRLNDDVIMENLRTAIARRSVPLVMTVAGDAFRSHRALWPLCDDQS